MRMTDYIKLAQAIKESTAIDQNMTGYILKNAFINRLCDILAADNKKFDKERFLEACK